MAEDSYDPVAVIDSRPVTLDEGNEEVVGELTELIVEASPGSRIELSLPGFGQLMKHEAYMFYIFMVVGGLCSPCSSPLCVRFYGIFWIVAFMLCMSTCAMNCWVRDPPFHNVLVDVMVVFIHVPGLLSFWFWGPSMRGSSSAVWKVFATIHENAAVWGHFCWGARIIGFMMIPAMVGCVFLVYVGFAYPAQIDSFNPHHDFSFVHAWAMWFVIPPVVCNILANAAFFGCIFIAHMRDVEKAALDLGVTSTNAHRLSTILRGRQIENRVEGTTQEWDSIIDANCCTLISLQNRLEDSCQLMSPFMALHLAFAVFTCFAVGNDLILSIFEPQHAKRQSIYTMCVDAFLSIAACMDVFGILFTGAHLTGKVDSLVIDCVNAMIQHDVPMRVATPVMQFMQTAGRPGGTGFKIFGNRVDNKVLVAFCSGLISVLGFIFSAYSFVHS